jgi:hypothetical protein
MRERSFAAACVCAGLALAGCGSSGSNSVSSASLQPRLLPSNSIPGFGLQRTLDWSDPVNLVGEGLFLPQATHPSIALKEFKNAHLRGASGEVFTSGAGPTETEVRVGVALFSSAAGANRVRDWMHRQDLHQPCFSQCMFAPGQVTVAGIPSMRMVVQTSHVPPPPKGAPAGARFSGGPTNYLAEFTVGPYLYWTILQADPAAKAQFEEGVKSFYALAKQKA